MTPLCHSEDCRAYRNQHQGLVDWYITQSRQAAKLMIPVVIIALVPAISHICHNYCLVSIYKLHNQHPPPGRSVASLPSQQGNVVIYHRHGVSFNGRKMQICLSAVARPDQLQRY